MAIKNLIERFDSSYSVPTNIAITNGNTTDFRSVCNSVNEFQDFYDNFGQEIRQEGLITYELESQKTKRCKKVNDLWVWEIIPVSSEIEGLATEDYVNQQLGGKALVYLTQAEYEVLSEVEKNDETKVYNITDGQLSYNDLTDKPDIETLTQKINELTARVEALEVPTGLIN